MSDEMNKECSNDRFKRVFEAMPLGCVLWSRDYRMIDCSEASGKLFGFENKADYIKRFSEHMPPHQPDGEPSAEKARRMLDIAFAEGYCHFEWEHLSLDGKPVPTEITLTRIDDGEDCMVAAYTNDLRAYRKLREEIERQNALLLTVNSMSILMLQSNLGTFNGNLLRSMNVLGAAAGADRVYVWKNSLKEGMLYCSQIYEWSPAAEPMQNDQDAPEIAYAHISPEWEQALSQGHCINGVVGDMPASVQAILVPQGILSVLIVPIFLEEVFWGFVGFDDCRQERTFAWDEENILRCASELIANALIRHEEAERARQADERMRLMLDATPLGCVLIDSNYQAIDCNEEVLHLIGAADKQSLLDNFFGFAPVYQPDGSRSGEKAFLLLEQAFATGSAAFEWLQRSAEGSLFPVEVTCVRVAYGKDFMIAAYARDLRPIRSMEKNIVQLESKVQKIYDDSLTGIYNRRFFDENLERVIKTLSRLGGMLSVMMIDIDYFKQYNDTYGHIAGDACLKRIAQALHATLSRNDDFVARYGGEEFAVVLPNTGVNGARIMAQRLLETIQQLNIPHEKSKAQPFITVSIGVVSGKVLQSHLINDFIASADKMLYEAKQNGRNTYRCISL